MKDFKEKLDQMLALKAELSEHIEEVYIKYSENNARFIEYIDDWSYDTDIRTERIWIEGDDEFGDNVSDFLDIEWLTDFDAALKKKEAELAEKKQKLAKEAEENNKLQELISEQYDITEYERLKLKFEEH